MQRPRIAPAVETRCDLNVVKACGYVGDDPEDEEEAHPRHTDYHGHVFAREAERNHAHKIKHPVYDEGGVAVGDGIP